MIPTARSRLALRFFSVAITLLTIAAAIVAVAVRVGEPPRQVDHVAMPAAFWISTVLLAFGSVTLHRAAWLVRVQQLQPFRRSLVMALLIGTLFVGVQTVGLWRIAQNQNPDAAQTGANAFVVMVATLHGVHFVVAWLFVAWVTVNAFADRYDHEHFWSVSFCAWFWHVLGIVWLVILTLFAVGALVGIESGAIPDPQVL